MILHTFKIHINHHKSIKLLLLPFIYNLLKETKLTVWKECNKKFKVWKKDNNITKKTLRNYKQNNKSNNSNSNSHTTNQTTQNIPFFTLHDGDSLCNRSNHVAFIYATSSNFLHSGPWHNHICSIDLSANFNFSYNELMDLQFIYF
jgi:hypothetical protein